MPSGDRTRNFDLAAVALATGKMAKQAGSAAGVSERTVFEWLAQKSFKARVAELRGQMVSAALGRLADGLCTASDALLELLKSRSANVKLRAARSVIELALKLREQCELSDRLEAVERALEGGDAGEQGEAQAGRGAGEGGAGG